MSQRNKIDYTQKIEITRKYIAGKISRREAARQAKVVEDVIVSWARIYRNSGAEGFLPGSRYTVYSSEIKREAVEEYLSGKESQDTICEKYKIRSRTQLRTWIKVYNVHGDLNSAKHSGGGSYMKEAHSTTHEERILIVKDCVENGKDYGEMALKYKVSYQQVRTWVLHFEELGEAGLEDRRGRRKKDQTPRTELEQAQIEIEQLKHKLYLSEMENTLLKKLDEIERRDAFHK